MFFDRALAIGSGLLGVLLLAGAALHLREPVAGVPVAGPSQVADAANEAAAASSSVRGEALRSQRPASASITARPRIQVVVWPSEAPPIAARPRFVERRSTRIVPAAVRIERKAAAPMTRIALGTAAVAAKSPLAVKPVVAASEQRLMRHTDRLAKHAYAVIVPAPTAAVSVSAPVKVPLAIKQRYVADRLLIEKPHVVEQPRLIANPRLLTNPRLVAKLRYVTSPRPVKKPQLVAMTQLLAETPVVAKIRSAPSQSRDTSDLRPESHPARSALRAGKAPKATTGRRAVAQPRIKVASLAGIDAHRPVAAAAKLPAAAKKPAARGRKVVASTRLSTPAWYLAPLAKRPVALTQQAAALANKPASPANHATTTAKAHHSNIGALPKFVALRVVAAKPKPPHAHKRTFFAPLPEPPVGYNAKPNVVPLTIDATTATSIATDTSDEHVPSVIVLKRGR